jgi:DNA-binding SARP family transcriptional activator
MSKASRVPRRVHLLGGFELRVGRETLAVPAGSQRLIAYVALNPLPTQRASVSGTLWPWKRQDRADANLRAALWRLPGSGAGLIVGHGHQLALDESVHCDVRELERAARAVIGGSDLRSRARSLDMLTCAAELLPDWDEDWLVIERERLRQLRLLALDALTAHLIELGKLTDAVLCALTAVNVEPLRESSQRALVAAHMANGNLSEAQRQFSNYAELLRRELNATPSAGFARLIHRRDPPITAR